LEEGGGGRSGQSIGGRNSSAVVRGYVHIYMSGEEREKGNERDCEGIQKMCARERERMSAREDVCVCVCVCA